MNFLGKINQTLLTLEEREQIGRALELMPAVRRLAEWALLFGEKSNLSTAEVLLHAGCLGKYIDMKCQCLTCYLQRTSSSVDRLRSCFGYERQIYIGSIALFVVHTQVKKILKVLPGVVSGNDYIVRDETAHVNRYAALYKALQRQLPRNVARRVILSALHAQIEFIKAILPKPLPNMNATDMIAYLEHQAARLFADFG